MRHAGRAVAVLAAFCVAAGKARGLGRQMWWKVNCCMVCEV